MTTLFVSTSAIADNYDAEGRTASFEFYRSDEIVVTSPSGDELAGILTDQDNLSIINKNSENDIIDVRVKGESKMIDLAPNESFIYEGIDYYVYETSTLGTYLILNIDEKITFDVVGLEGAANPQFKKVDLYNKVFDKDLNETWNLIASGDINSDGSFLIENLFKDLLIGDGIKSIYLQVSNDYASPTTAAWITKTKLHDDKVVISQLKAEPYDQKILGNVDGKRFNVVRTNYSKGTTLTFIPSLMYGFRNNYLEEFDSVKYFVEGNSLCFDLYKGSDKAYTYSISTEDQTNSWTWYMDCSAITPGTDYDFDYNSDHTFSPNPIHDMIFVPGVEPTQKDDGHIGYYYCSRCERYFEDEAGLIVIENLEEWLKTSGKIDSWETQFAKYKQDRINALKALKRDGDTKTITDIIDKAIKDIEALTYDSDLTLDENLNKVTTIYETAKASVDALREEVAQIIPQTGDMSFGLICMLVLCILVAGGFSSRLSRNTN